MIKLKAVNISGRHACLIGNLPDNSALISINDEHRDLYPLKIDRERGNVLTLQFTDIVYPIELSDKEYCPLTVDGALNIINFIDIHRFHNFIVHCAAGISRSAAICLYIHMIYGHELKKRFWALSEPNPHVLGRLLIERKRKKF